MNIGMMIKKYRNQRDLTQEQLSEYLNVSVSAVSQWESGKTVPDVSTLLALANFFDITLDELFDRTSKDKEKAIEEYCNRSREYSHRGEVRNNLFLWREAVQKYPGNFLCLSQLAYALEATVYSSGDSDELEKNANESIAICERILRDCTENELRNAAIQILVHLYSNKDFSIANEEKAVEYAMMADSMMACRELLLESAYFTEESKEKRLHTKHSNILNYMDLLTMNLYYGKHESEEEKIEACTAALKMWQTLIYDGNYQFFHCRIQKIYIALALSYGKLQKRSETIEALKNALYHAKCYDTLPEGEQHYTSIFVKAATSDASGSTKNYTFTNTDDVMRFKKNKVFDFIREDAEFLAIDE